MDVNGFALTTTGAPGHGSCVGGGYRKWPEAPPAEVDPYRLQIKHQEAILPVYPPQRLLIQPNHNSRWMVIDAVEAAAVYSSGVIILRADLFGWGFYS